MVSFLKIKALCSGLLLFLGISAVAQQVTLQTGSFSLISPTADTTGYLTLQSESGEANYFFVARFKKNTAFAKNAAGNYQLFEKIAPFTYLVKSKTAPLATWCEQQGIDAIGTLPAKLKLDKRLLQGDLPTYALAGKGRVKLLVGVWGKIGRSQLMQAFTEMGWENEDGNRGETDVLSGTLPTENLEKLAGLPYVYFIQPKSPEDRSLNEGGRSTSGTMLLNLPEANGGRNLNGQGITIGVGDDSDPTNHPDIQDRVLSYTPGIANNHGAHTAGTVAGAGIRQPRAAGMAPKARVISQWFSGIWQNAATYTTNFNMVVTNNSYGTFYGDCSYAGVYDLDSRRLDQQAFDFPQLLHVFAAGNDGDITCLPYPQRFQTILGGYQSAKNILTVGRTDYTQVASGSSSSGPVRDGRLKPEITALGIIRSLNGAGTGYFVEFGTSMSSPLVAGGLGLLYQRYRQLHGQANPRGDLMKALLLNGARDVGNTGPDYRHGYGTMMLERSLRMLENKTYLSRTVAQGQQQDSVINIAAGTAQLKVLLYWHDPAANPLAAKTLVHDLDLEVIGPGGVVVYPKILSQVPGEVNLPATEGPDRLNNSEQVIIDNPVPGNYTIRVKGHEIAAAEGQVFAVAFDKIMPELRFTYPLEQSVVTSGTQVAYVVWEDTDPATAGSTYTLELSTDNGNTWQPIVSGLKDTTRLYDWQPGNVRTTEARLRLTKGTVQVISQKFAILPNLTQSVAPVANQCYGSFRINFTPLTPGVGETIEYEVRLKQGPEMRTIAVIDGSNNFFVLRNLHPDSTYLAAIAPRVNGISGLYANALERRPNTGNCDGSISDGDLMLDSITTPFTGRQFTSTALSASSTVTIRVRNLDNAASGSYIVKLSVNNGAFMEQSIANPIAARGTILHSFTGLNFSTPGAYQLTAVVQHTDITDNNPANDTFRTTIYQLANAPLLLTTPYTEGFEATDTLTLTRATMGVGGLQAWDYFNENPIARLRTQSAPDIPHTGNRAITLDVRRAVLNQNNQYNYLTGTFNLSNYNVSSHEVRLAFYYMHHGITQVPNAYGKVWVRGSDADAWVECFDLGAAQNPIGGSWQHVPDVNLSRTLLQAGQQFSASTQVRFGQFAQFSMADRFGFGGYSFDDIQLFLAENDAAITAISAPAVSGCAVAENATISVQVKNNMQVQLSNIAVRYRLNGGNWVQETIATLAAGATTTYHFTQKANLTATGSYLLEAEVLAAGDNIEGNNRMEQQILVHPVITNLPYSQDFESGPAGFLATGQNSSWAHGNPASWYITNAASGTKAWKTTLRGSYNAREKSYLYTPCFNISGMSAPVVSFALAYQLEDCRSSGVVCDAAWMEYSLDGQTWNKLGAFGQGENWYDYEPAQVWMRSDQPGWRRARMNLPQHEGTIRFRFVLESDDGVNRDGLAIDDFSIANEGPLPINWVSLEAILQNNYRAGLRWQVLGTKAGDRFSIQTAPENDSDNFTTIGQLVAASNQSVFNFEDPAATRTGTQYYRVVWQRQGSYPLISPVRTVTFSRPQARLNVFPNPAKTKLIASLLAGSNTQVSLRLLSADGRVLYSTVQTAAANGNLVTEINLNGLQLPKGWYLLEATYGNERQTRKWMKE
jgi:hypothetical protein